MQNEMNERFYFPGKLELSFVICLYLFLLFLSVYNTISFWCIFFSLSMLLSLFPYVFLSWSIIPFFSDLFFEWPFSFSGCLCVFLDVSFSFSRRLSLICHLFLDVSFSFSRSALLSFLIYVPLFFQIRLAAFLIWFFRWLFPSFRADFLFFTLLWNTFPFFDLYLSLSQSVFRSFSTCPSLFLDLSFSLFQTTLVSFSMHLSLFLDVAFPHLSTIS